MKYAALIMGLSLTLTASAQETVIVEVEGETLSSSSVCDCGPNCQCGPDCPCKQGGVSSGEIITPLSSGTNSQGTRAAMWNEKPQWGTQPVQYSGYAEAPVRVEYVEVERPQPVQRVQYVERRPVQRVQRVAVEKAPMQQELVMYQPPAQPMLKSTNYTPMAPANNTRRRVLRTRTACPNCQR